MPLQNRVTPFGEIVFDPSRGALMGNRGILHDADQRLGQSRWRHKHWVTCSLAFNGRKRPLMAPRSYTELFFLDEATALAAGHRPCAECRREDYERFMQAWIAGNALAHRPSARALDDLLHMHRVQPDGRRVTILAPAAGLPDGTMMVLGGAAWLVWQGQRHRWTFAFYGDGQPIEVGEVEVLTPSPIVAALRSGYRPRVDESAMLQR